MATNLGALILAGGHSSRMGSDKALLSFHDTTFVEHLVGVVGGVCDQVVVVAAQEQSLPVISGATVIRDSIPHQGPLYALADGLSFLAGTGVRRAFVCAVDMPLITEDLIAELVAHDSTAVVATAENRDQPFAAVYRTEVAGVARRLLADGRRAMRDLLMEVPVVRVQAPDSRALRPINTPEQFDQLR